MSSVDGGIDDLERDLRNIWHPCTVFALPLTRQHFSPMAKSVPQPASEQTRSLPPVHCSSKLQPPCLAIQGFEIVQHPSV